MQLNYQFISPGDVNEVYVQRTTDSHGIPNKFRTTSPQTPSSRRPTPPITNTQTPLPSTEDDTSIFGYLTSTLSFFYESSPFDDVETTTYSGRDVSADFDQFTSTVALDMSSETDSLSTIDLNATHTTESFSTMGINESYTTLGMETFMESTAKTALTTEGLDTNFPKTIGGKIVQSVKVFL